MLPGSAATVVPRWVHDAENATNVPAVGCATTTGLAPLTMTADPTGTFAASMCWPSAADEADEPDEPDEAGSAGAELGVSEAQPAMKHGNTSTPGRAVITVRRLLVMSPGAHMEASLRIRPSGGQVSTERLVALLY